MSERTCLFWMSREITTFLMGFAVLYWILVSYLIFDSLVLQLPKYSGNIIFLHMLSVIFVLSFFKRVWDTHIKRRTK